MEMEDCFMIDLVYRERDNYKAQLSDSGYLQVGQPLSEASLRLFHHLAQRPKIVLHLVDERLHIRVRAQAFNFLQQVVQLA